MLFYILQKSSHINKYCHFGTFVTQAGFVENAQYHPKRKIYMNVKHATLELGSLFKMIVDGGSQIIHQFKYIVLTGQSMRL